MKATFALSVVAAGLLVGSQGQPAGADTSLIQQWKNGLSGAQLTAYQGSLISNSSTLTVLVLCRNGRFSYSREGSWSTPSGPSRYRYNPETGGSGYVRDPNNAMGASNNKYTGRWDVRQQQGGVAIVYQTDQGQKGSFPVYLQGDGRVNIGGLAYRVQQGAAGC